MEGGPKLKDPRLVRIFISSPFKGMEEERQLLGKFYWPKIEAEVSEKGLNLRLVDMRWGISSSAMAAADTVNVCLKEISRSDVFVGMYGQRYGWHGLDDEQYQQNLDRAAKKFPWVDKYRDRSVTELEYIHGHLNDPGAMLACFCFRDEDYDKRLHQQTKGNLRRQVSYAAEDDNAMEKLKDLKERVEESADKTIGLLMDYSSPQKAAEYIYNCIVEHLNRKILSKMEHMENKDMIIVAHRAYQARVGGMKIVNAKYIGLLDEYVQRATEKCHPLTVVGPMGSGKSALLCDWLDKYVKMEPGKDSNKFYFYHFIGAEPSSCSPKNLMERMIDFVNSNIYGVTKQEKHTVNLSKLVAKTRETLMKMEEPEHKQKRLVIVVNDIQNIQLDKSNMPLFWLPQNLPPNVKIILSITKGCPTCPEKIKILQEGYGTEILELSPLDKEQKKKLCMKLLDENSKAMEEDQIELIVSSPKTSVPLFMTTMINELCVLGRFDKLTEQITDLLQCEGILGLFIKVIERVDREYQSEYYQGNAVEDVVCALSLCKQGMAESEFPMSADVWSPIIFALSDHLVDHGGLLGFTFPEMAQAVEAVYTKSAEKKQAMANKLSKIFRTQYDVSQKKRAAVTYRTATALLHLLQLGNDKEQFLEVLSDIRVFEVISKANVYELNELWQWLDIPSEKIAKTYIKSLNAYIRNNYCLNWDSSTEYQSEALEKKSVLACSVREWLQQCKLFGGVCQLIELEISIDTLRPGLTDMQREKILCDLKYQKATYLSDIGDHEEALKLLTECLETNQKLVKSNMVTLEDFGMICNAAGLGYYNLKIFDEAENVFKMGLAIGNDLRSKQQQSSIYSNLGLVSLERKQYDMALDQFNTSLKVRQEFEPDVLSLDLAYGYHNLGLTHRNMKNYDTAATFYTKALQVKEKLLGRRSLDAAMSIMNLGTLEGYRENHEKSLEYAREALDIFKDVAPDGSNYVSLATENVANQLVVLGRFEEAEPLFNEVRSARGLPAMHRRFVQWYMRQRQPEKASQVAFDLVQWTDYPGDFVMLHWAQKNLPPGKAKKLPEWATIDFAYKKWPRFPPLLSFKLADLLEANPKGFEAFLVNHCQQGSVEDTIKSYAEVAVLLKDELKDMKRAIEALEIGVKKNPGNTRLSGILKSLKPS